MRDIQAKDALVVVLYAALTENRRAIFNVKNVDLGLMQT
jgi:hypothetical protein